MFELNLFTSILLVIVGFVLLCKSADILVDGAVAIAEHLGISPMIIGLTVVSIGTSAPEMAASIAAALGNNGSIAIGNVIGSNVANIALIGGFCSIIRPISVNIRMLKVELPVMIGSIFLLLPFMISGKIMRIEGLILFVIFVSLLLALVKNAKKDSIKELGVVGAGQTEKVKEMSFFRSGTFVVLGLIGLSLGAKISLSGAVYIGHWAGMSESVIGLTIVAIGTSLPELITCLVASYKKQDDISVGNLVGSNIFNTLLVIGTASLVRPLDVERGLLVRDFPVMACVSVAFILFAMWHRSIRRGGGVVLLASYIAYMTYLLIIKTA
ncbi:MAG: calcium/sodium antiporter [Sedimentisphaeraceae bacterium JB056]